MLRWLICSAYNIYVARALTPTFASLASVAVVYVFYAGYRTGSITVRSKSVSRSESTTTSSSAYESLSIG